MRVVENQQLELGESHIGQIQISRKSRDDIPAQLIGLQHLYMKQSTRQVLFDLLQAEILPNRSHRVGGPGMWSLMDDFSAGGDQTGIGLRFYLVAGVVQPR